MNQQHNFNLLKTELQTLVSTVQAGITVNEPDLTDIKTNTSDTAANTADIVGNTADILQSVVDANQPLVTLGTTTYTKTSSIGTMVSAVRNEAQMDLCDVDGRDCPVSVNSKGNMHVDLVKVLGTAIDTNTGALSNGTTRFTLATDDPTAVNINKIAGSYDGSSNLVQVNLRAINDSGVSKNSGVKDDGCQRMVIATDDVNLSALTACLDQVNHHVEVDTNAINGVTMAVDAGNNSTGVQRVCIASDDVNLASIKSDIASILAILNDIWDNANNYIRTHETP